MTEGTDYVVEKYKFTTSDDTDTTTGEVDGKVKVVLKTTTKNGHKYLKNTNFIVKMVKMQSILLLSQKQL